MRVVTWITNDIHGVLSRPAVEHGEHVGEFRFLLSDLPEVELGPSLGKHSLVLSGQNGGNFTDKAEIWVASAASRAVSRALTLSSISDIVDLWIRCVAC